MLFPAFAPSSRRFTPGSYPQDSYRSMNGRQTNVAHGNGMLSSSLALQFIGLSEVEMFEFLQHYNGQGGTFASFQLPAETFSGFPSIVVGTGAAGAFGSYRWRYASPPTVQEFASSPSDIRFNVSISLETTQPLGAIVAGAMFTIAASLTAGAATASSNVDGISRSITWTLAPGAAAAYIAPGADLTITWTLAGGAATADSSATGITQSLTWTLNAGAATNLAPGLALTATWTMTGGAASS